MSADGEDARQPKLPPAYRLVALDSVESTNDEAKRLAREGAEDGTLVWAREQRRGRGRYGRDWESPRGNLYLSLVLRPDCPVSEATQLGFVAALALGDALGVVLPPLAETRVKWPNDVLVNDKKVAGLLLEAETEPDGGLAALILGLGVNVAHHPEETPFPASNLRAEGAGADVDEVSVLEAFARHFLTWVNRWLDEGFAPVRDRWLKRAIGVGEQVEARLAHETLTGTFREIDETGALVLELTEGEQRRIAAGDVYFAG